MRVRVIIDATIYYINTLYLIIQLQSENGFLVLRVCIAPPSSQCEATVIITIVTGC